MNSIEALLTLLDDPDPVVHESLIARLTTDRDLLDKAWCVAKERGAMPPALINTVLTMDSEELIDNYALIDDLETGVWLLPRLHLPRHDYATPGMEALDTLAERIGCDAEADEIATFLCQEIGLSGNRDHYHDPLNSYLPFVLDRRVGLPITLTAIWMLIGRRLGHELEAVAAPSHVLGRWHGGFIDLFDGGAIISIDELERRVRAAGQPSAMPFLAPASDRALLRRMARNLVNAYTRQNDTLRATIAHGLATA
jgi:regulator of sirC expression with transglutaminase-like and TPR domain